MVGATRVYGSVYHFQAAINLRLYLNPAFREKGKSSLVGEGRTSVRRSNFENFCLRCSILFLMLYTSVYLFVFCRFPLVFAGFFFHHFKSRLRRIVSARNLSLISFSRTARRKFETIFGFSIKFLSLFGKVFLVSYEK